MPKVYFYDTGFLCYRLYEVKAGCTFKPEYMANMNHVAGLLPEEATKTVIYDGPTSAPLLLNIRDI